MDEKEILDLEANVRNTGLAVTGYRRIGASFVELHVKLQPGVDFKEAIAELRKLGFYEIRLDTDNPEDIELTHTCY